MNCRKEFLAKHKSTKTQMKLFVANGTSGTTMLTGIISDFDEDSVIIGKCLVNWDHITSITPKE